MLILERRHGAESVCSVPSRCADNYVECELAESAIAAR
jgi:hypothetical protein